MSSLREKAAAIRAFVNDVALEMRKTSWPSRRELVESTIVVIVSLLLLSFFVGLSDKILVSLLQLLFRAG